MAMSVDELIQFWASVNVDGRRIEQLYSLILNGIDKKDMTLTPDESKAWDVIAADIDENPVPEGSTVEFPSFN